MQAYFVIRGHRMWQKRFIDELNAKYIPFMFKDPLHPNYPNNEFESRMVEMMVRPIELYELVFPKEAYDVVMTTVFGKDQTAGAQAYPNDKMKLFQYGARKLLGAKPFKEWKSDKALVCTKNGLSILGLGIREDADREYGEAL